MRTVVCCRYSRRICATNAIEGHNTTANSPCDASFSTMRSEIRVLPVPQGNMILPRACPAGNPAACRIRSCSRSIRTLSDTASFCMARLCLNTGFTINVGLAMSAFFRNVWRSVAALKDPCGR